MLKLQNESGLLTATDSTLPQANLSFLDYQPNFEAMEALAAKHRHCDTLLLIGHGGSANTFRGIYEALKTSTTPRLVVVDTNEPDYLQKVRAGLNPDRTLLLAVSKSGENVSQIEALLYFYDLPHKVFVTGDKGVLKEMSAVDHNIDVLAHPPIGGRFTGFTEVALFASIFCGFDARALRSVLANRDEVLLAAWKVSQHLWQLEQKGKDIVLLSQYGSALRGFGLFVQQIIHETFGKQGMGLTVVPVDSPESQHHTSQRLLDGRANISILFVKCPNQTAPLNVPQQLQAIKLKETRLGQFDKHDLAKSFAAEYTGVKERADELGIANMTLDTGKMDAAAVGEYILFWQAVAIYGAMLRKVDPFDQPAVEASKVISFQERFK